MLDLQIVEAEEPGLTRQVVGLLRDYFLWLRRRYVAELHILDAHYDEGERTRELADLRGRYGTPHGAILLARVGGAAVGCVMMRGVGDGVCEMKRLFVRPAFHGLGIARALVCRLAILAGERGYVTIRLETGPRQFEAQALYRSIGFKEVAPYYEAAGWFKDNMLFFEATTRDIACQRTRARERRPKAAAAAA